MKIMSNRLVAPLMLGMLMFLPELAWASSSSGMPWEGPLAKVVDSITGPVAFGISVLGIAAAGMSLAFGGQLDGLLQKLVMIALVISLIVLATNVLSALFGISGSLLVLSSMTVWSVA
jgi:type IV secretory pathway VirB2 component (pilin)